MDSEQAKAPTALAPKAAMLLGLLWAVSIFVTSSGVVTIGQMAHFVSGAAGGRISEGQFRQFWVAVWWVFVKGWHAAEFAILYLLLRRAIPTKPIAVTAIAMAFAVSDEFHQLFVPSRGCRASDVCIDWLGILAAWALSSRVIFKLRSTPLLLLVALSWIAGIFVLSVYPFGLVTLGSGPSAAFRP